MVTHGLSSNCKRQNFISTPQNTLCDIFQFLTYRGRMTHMCIGSLTIIGSDKWLVAWSAPSNYLNQCGNTVNWTLRNKLQWNFHRNWYIFIRENAFVLIYVMKFTVIAAHGCLYYVDTKWPFCGPVASFPVHLSHWDTSWGTIQTIVSMG